MDAAALPGSELQYEIERFLVMEAEMLDRRDFEAWLDLLDDGVRYLIPTPAIHAGDGSADSHDVSHGNAYIDETKDALTKRIRRIGLSSAWSEQPPARTCRFVSNVRITPTPTPDALVVASSLLVYRSRLPHDGRLFAGARRDRIRRDDSHRWRLVRREVQVLDAVMEPDSLSIIF